MHKSILQILPYALCFIFFVAYTTLSIVRHQNYQSYGFDLGINDQIVWEYSNLEPPITTIDHVPNISKLEVHVEFIYALLAPFYWIWPDVRMILILQAGFVSFSGLAIFYLAKNYKVHLWIQYALLFTYLLFFGVQNALWFDLHSSTFAAAFTSWFLFCLISKKTKWAMLFFILGITAKENVALRTLLIGTIYTVTTKNNLGAYFAIGSLLYLVFTFGIYFPNFVSGGYRFDNEKGLFFNLDPMLMINTNEKLQVYWYTFLSYGFLSILNPLYLLPVFGNLASYFIIGSNVTGAQGLFMHYRIGLAPLMSWATIATIAKYKWLNKKSIAIYLVCCALLAQYTLHLPLSYLTKQWFWTKPSAVKNIEEIIHSIPADDSIVAQNNIIPHISQRHKIFSLWPGKKDFVNNPPCEQKTCNWITWYGNANYLIVDTSNNWDIRHILANREEFIDGLRNLEKAGIIKPYKRVENTTLYQILKNP